MGLLDSILGAASGKTDPSGEANSLVGILGGLLTQSGGLQGLANKFSQSGCGGAFASWVRHGRKPVRLQRSNSKMSGFRPSQSAGAKNGD